MEGKMNDVVYCTVCHRAWSIVNPEYFCLSCVRYKTIHSCDNSNAPVKWFSTLFENNKMCELKVENIINKTIDRKYFEQKSLIERYKISSSQIEDKIKEIKQRISNRKHELRVVHNKNRDIYHKKDSIVRCISKVEQHIEKLKKHRTEIISFTNELQIKLHKIQRIILNEVFRIFPFTITKYERHTICEVPFNVKFSDSSISLEPNENTCSSILLLSIMISTISTILHLPQNSLDIRQVVIKSLSTYNNPLTRDELMNIYELIVKLTYFIVRTTINRSIVVDNKNIHVFSWENFPLLLLNQFRNEYKCTFDGRDLSDAYSLDIPCMFQSRFLDDLLYSMSNNTANEICMGFVEVSGDIPTLENIA